MRLALGNIGQINASVLMEDLGLLPTLWLIQVTMEKERALLMRPKNDLLAMGFHACGALLRGSTLPAASSQVGASPGTAL